MSSKFLIYTIFWCGYLLVEYGGNGSTIYMGGAPNITGFTPTATTFRTTYLFQSPINISLTVYQRPVNNTHKVIIRVLTGSTNIDSVNRCISYGVSFNLWGRFPIIDNQAIGNGGCDAILGSKCSRNILSSLFPRFSNDDKSCGIDTKFLGNPPDGCPEKIGGSSLSSRIFLKNGVFMSNGSALNPTIPWIYEKSDPLTDHDYDEWMKNFVFVYFFGVEDAGSLGWSTDAIACLSFYHATASANV